MTTKQKEQAMKALKNANKVRMNGAGLKKQVETGQITFRQAIKKKEAQPLKLRYLIRSVPRYGPNRTTKLIDQRLNLPVHLLDRRIKDLSDHQKKLIVRGVEEPDFWVALTKQ